LNIEGGNIKTYCETRWTLMYETTSSVLRLQTVLEYVSLFVFIISFTNYLIIKNLKLYQIINIGFIK
jgi:hypothetical protein